jgi:CubicO group peptidase (beta-lactamase class C family)
MRMLPALVVLMLTACGATTTPVSSPPMSRATTRVDAAHLDRVLSGAVEQGAAVGVSALVWQNGREVYFGAYGFADREAGRPMARDTVVQIYSMTKPVTGVVLMSLYDEGRFALDDPLAKHLPEFAGVRLHRAAGEPIAPARPIQVIDILRHTAGLATVDDTTPADAPARAARLDDRNRSLAELSTVVAALPLEFEPGTRWRYGPAVDIQARLAEHLAGKPYIRLLRERVLEPLRMHDTGYFVPDAQRGRLARMYALRDGRFERLPDAQALAHVTHDWPQTPGSYGLASTLDDYMRFARMLLGRGTLDGVRILEPDTVALMATDALPPGLGDRSWLPSKGQVGFGIDFAVRHAPPADAREASGEVGEFFWDGYANTLFWLDPRNDLAAVLFTQYTPPGGSDLHKRFRDAVYLHDVDASSAAAGDDR